MVSKSEGGPTPEQPDNQKRIIKIEDRSASEALDSAFGYGPEFDEQTEQANLDYLNSLPLELEDLDVSAVKPLAYIPFDVVASFKSIRKLNAEERQLPVAERRSLIQHRITELKEQINRQRLGIATIIRDLYQTVLNNPDIGQQELLDIVQDTAEENKLTESQLKSFKSAIEKFALKRQAVEKYRALHPDDNQLFEVCFGKTPRGKVTVVKGPMTLHFQCFDKEDYAWAYNFYQIKEDQKDLSKKDEDKADLSVGAALAKTKIEELAGAVTIENVSHHTQYEFFMDQKTAELYNSNVELYVDAQRKDIDIEVTGFGRWQIKFLESDQYSFPTRIQLVDLNKPDEKILCDVTRVYDEHDNRLLKYVGEPGDKKHHNAVEVLQVAKDGRNVWVGHVDIDNIYIKISDKSPQGTLVKYAESDYLMVPGKAESRNIQVHEQQHQFNKLFVPLEERLNELAIRARAVDTKADGREKTPEEIEDQLVKDAVVHLRQNFFDGRARDEIISYYMEGRNLDNILETLRESRLYDYYEEKKEALEKTSAVLAEQISKEMSEVHYGAYPDDTGEHGYLIDAKPFMVSETRIKKYVEAIFKDQYKRDLGLWIDSIKLLEAKGYNRQEILTLLIQEPVKNWSALARRLSDRTKEAKAA